MINYIYLSHFKIIWTWALNVPRRSANSPRDICNECIINHVSFARVGHGLSSWGIRYCLNGAVPDYDSLPTVAIGREGYHELITYIRKNNGTRKSHPVNVPLGPCQTNNYFSVFLCNIETSRKVTKFFILNISDSIPSEWWIL